MGANPLIYLIKIWEYKNSLRKLIYELRKSFTNKNIRKKLKILVAFLINQKIGGQLGFLPRSFFLKIIRSKLWESHLAKKKNANFFLIIPLWRAKIKTCIDSKTSRN